MRTFKQTLRRALVLPFGAAGGLLVALAYLVIHPVHPHHVAPPHRLDPVKQMIAAHHCWTGFAPPDMAGKFPGHVVVSTDTHLDPMYSRRLVGPALDKVLKSATLHPHLKVHAFCR